MSRSDSESEDDEVPAPDLKLKRRTFICLSEAVSILTLLICLALLVFVAIMEAREETIEQSVALLTKAQMKSSHKTGRMLNSLLELSDFSTTNIVDSDVQELCNTKKCGLQCAHGKSNGFVGFLDGLVKKIPAALEMIPGVGHQLSQVSNMALGLQDTIEKSHGFKLNGAACAQAMLKIFRNKKVKERDELTVRKKKKKRSKPDGVSNRKPTVTDVTHLYSKWGHQGIQPGRQPGILGYESQRRGKREADPHFVGDEIPERDDQALGQALEEATGLVSPYEDDPQLALSLFLSEIFNKSFE